MLINQEHSKNQQFLHIIQLLIRFVEISREEYKIVKVFEQKSLFSKENYFTQSGSTFFCKGDFW